eukprot:2912309-Prymnesium_polylepis.4
MCPRAPRRHDPSLLLHYAPLTHPRAAGRTQQDLAPPGAPAGGAVLAAHVSRWVAHSQSRRTPWRAH